MFGLAPESMISVLAITLLGTGALLARLPVGTCRECTHCRLEKLAREREQAAQQGQPLGRALSAPFCAVCGRHHRPDEDHPF
jgi:hypothetical protein